jgi:hypothetical protein
MAAMIRIGARGGFLLIPPFLHSEKMWEEKAVHVSPNVGRWNGGTYSREPVAEGSVLYPALEGDTKALQRAEAAYRDDSYPERLCDRTGCGKLYRGPAVYCCLTCALAAA